MLDVFFSFAADLTSPQSPPSYLAQNWTDTTKPYDSAQSAYDAAVVFYQQEAFFQAIEAYQTAIALDPSFDAAYINLSLLYIGLGQLTEAETLLKQVLTLPDRAEFPASIHALADYNLGVIYFRQDNLPAAIEMLQKAVAIAPDFVQAKDFLQQLNTAKTTP